jgi:acyl-CoA thioesterase
MGNEIFDAIRKNVETEPYAVKMGIKLLELDLGYSVVEMKFTEDMANLFGMAHGGAIFSLIDEAFETASNSHGTVAVALNMSISYIKAPAPGDTLKAAAKEISRSFKIANYDIKVTNNSDDLIASCQATVYRKKDKLPFLD